MSFTLNNSYYNNQTCTFDYSKINQNVTVDHENGTITPTTNIATRCEETSVTWYKVYEETMVGNVAMITLDIVPLAHFSEDKVNDVLTDETRYQLTQEDIDYFTEKYDIDNMDAFEMDCMLYEMEQMGAITQSERLAMHPYIDVDGLPRDSVVEDYQKELGSSMINVSREEFQGVYDPYKENTFSCFSDMIADLKNQIFEAYATGEDVTKLEDNLTNCTFVIDFLLDLFQRDEEGNDISDKTEETAFERQMKKRLDNEDFMKEFMLKQSTDTTETMSRSALLGE